MANLNRYIYLFVCTNETIGNNLLCCDIKIIIWHIKTIVSLCLSSRTYLAASFKFFAKLNTICLSISNQSHRIFGSAMQCCTSSVVSIYIIALFSHSQTRLSSRHCLSRRVDASECWLCGSYWWEIETIFITELFSVDLRDPSAMSSLIKNWRFPLQGWN